VYIVEEPVEYGPGRIFCYRRVWKSHGAPPGVVWFYNSAIIQLKSGSKDCFSKKETVMVHNTLILALITHFVCVNHTGMPLTFRTADSHFNLVWFPEYGFYLVNGHIFLPYHGNADTLPLQFPKSYDTKAISKSRTQNPTCLQKTGSWYSAHGIPLVRVGVLEA